MATLTGVGRRYASLVARKLLAARPALIVVALLAALSSGGSASADLVLPIDTAIAGSVPVKAVSSKPYAVATFQDIEAGVVLLTMSTNFKDDEIVDEWLFNSKVDPTELRFNYSSAHSSGPGGAVVLSATQTRAGDPDMMAGLFNIEFRFKTTGGSLALFNGTDTVAYFIFGTGITADTFALASIPVDTILGGYETALHFRGTTAPTGSIGSTPTGIRAVSAPSSLALMSGACVLLIGDPLRRRVARIVRSSP